MSTEVAVREHHAPAPGFEMKPRNMEEAMKFCELMANSDLVPKDYKGKPGNIMVAIQLGLELGMSPMKALRSIAVVNGRATLWGDDVLAMVLNSPVCEWVDESESTDTKGVCKTKRVGHPEHVSIFTLDDAKRAGLLGKQGPWQMHTARMLKLRARGFCLRDKYADVLSGLITTEEAMDLPATPTEPEVSIEVKPPSLKEKLKAQLVEAAAEPEPEPETAPEQDPMDPEALLADYRKKIQEAATVADATTLFNQAADLGCFVKGQMDGLRLDLNKRLGELGRKR